MSDWSRALLDRCYSSLLFPLALRSDPEQVHERVLHSLGNSWRGRPLVRLLQSVCAVNAPDLERVVWGLRFRNPIGLAAGFDKNAAALPLFSALGFGHIEVGTVTPEPQAGNPRPRIFRYPADGALINRMGFPSAGSLVVAKTLRRWRERMPLGSSPIVGVNIGKQKETSVDNAARDYVTCFSRLSPFADYVTLNVSSPNTPELRKLQEPERLRALFDQLAQVRQRAIPLLVKIAPDLSSSELGEIVDVCRTSGVEGLIATNTTVGREGLTTHTSETGGLSGLPLRSRALSVVADVRSKIGPDFPLVGVGGIRTAEDVNSFFDAGATLVQVYTGLVYEGPGLVAKLCRGVQLRT